MRAVGLGLVAAGLLLGCAASGGSASAQEAQSGLTGDAAKYAGKWVLRLSEDEKRSFNEAKLAYPVLEIRVDGTWTFDYVGEIRTGTAVAKGASLEMSWEKSNGVPPNPKPVGPGILTRLDSDFKAVLWEETGSKANFTFDRAGVSGGSGGSAP